MRKKLETIEELASVQETAKKMKDKNVSSLVVVDKEGNPQGLVTERDLVRKVLCINDVHTGSITNKEIMSSPLITINSKSSPSIAADMMLQNNVRHLLVVEEEGGGGGGSSHQDDYNTKNKDVNSSSKPIGIVTPLDFTRSQEYRSDEDNKDTIEKILEYYI
jgi:CBS domain-containing protein